MLRWSSWEMAALALLEDIANGRIRRERVFRDHYDFLAHDDDWLISRFRFPRAVLLELCAELGPVLERDTARSRASPVPLQVLTALGFLATGSFQRELADRSGISQSSLSRAMPAVLDGIICKVSVRNPRKSLYMRPQDRRPVELEAPPPLLHRLQWQWSRFLTFKGAAQLRSTQTGSIMAVALAIIDGVSLLGRTIDQISQSINTGRNVTIEITNYSNKFTLTNPRIYTYSGYCSHPPQPTIGKMMKEACSFSKTPRTACGSVGVLTYQVLSNEEKHVSELAIMFSVPFDYNLYENMFALGIYEPNKACDKNLYTEMYNGNGSIMAVALAIVDGVSLSGTSVEQISQSINTGRNATIEITNYSNKFTLTNPRTYTYSGYCYHPPQPTIGKMMREACSFSKTAHTACGSVGVLTYQICSNEEKHVGDLAIMFSVPFDYNHYENMFALGIYEPHKACSIMAVALAIIDGVSLSGTSVEQISQSINTGRNVTIEITNYSNKFTLTNPRTYTYSGYCYHPPQPTIGKMMREACSFSKTSHTACGSVGVLTYQIICNEEKHVGDLAIMFSVPFDYNHYENMFALGIYEPNKACDKNLYTEMYYGEGSIMAVALAIIDGVSLLGRTIDQISQSINTGRNVTIEITNHSNNFTLTNPRIYTYSGYCSHPPQPTIGKMMKEACSFSKTPRTACGCVGVLTYQVLSNEEKHVGDLAIMFSVPFDYNLYENMFALGIYEPNKACDNSLYTEMYNGNGSIMAVALAIIDGVSLLGRTIDQISQSINTGRNVTIEITNHSNNFTLTNPRIYTYSGYCSHPPQPTIGKMMKEACSFSKTPRTACGSVGVLTYQVLSNEEKHVSELAIMFSVPFDYNLYENMFALGIYEPNKACDKNLYTEMYNGNGSIMAVALAIIDGVSLLGRTIDQISQSINTGRNVTIEITNHSNNFTLTNPRIYTYSGYCSHPPQPTIGKMMKEACSFSKTPRTACGSVGVLTYQVLSNEEKHVSELAIMFSVPFDYNLYENMFALGIYEPNKACDKNLYTEMYNGNGSIMAVALAIIDGVSLSGTSVEQISQSINTGRNVTIEITNYSNKFTLTNPRTYTYSGYCYHPPQPTIGKMMREACSFSKTSHTACGSVGVLTYQIICNEEKHVGDLAIMFSVPFDYNHYENMFALGIYEPNKACDDSLYNEMYYGEGSIMAVALAIIDGVSLLGRTIDQISQSINTGRNVTIEITNHSNNFTLTNPRIYTYSGYCSHPPQPTIGKMMKEACSFSKTPRTACGCVGVLTYQVLSNEEKHVSELAIMFSVPFDYNLYENMFALGIYEPNKACDKNLYTEMYNGNGSIMAVALAIVDGVSLSGTSVEQISQSINTGRNATIEITNYSNKFTLTNPRTYTYSGYCYHPPQPTIGKMMREACSFSKTAHTACGSVGVLTYQICSNEEKHVGDLAIMFSVPFDYNHYENMFALGIYEPHKACSIMAVALAIIDGVSLSGTSVEQISQSINTGRNVTIEITNYSNKFTLTNPRTYTYSGYCYHPPQPTIGKMMREACSFSKTSHTACGSVGVLTYQIICNEEKHVGDLAIMFSVPFDYNHYENMFALGIYEPNKACDKNLYTEMYYGEGSIMAVALAIIDGVSLLGRTIDQISQSINTGRNVTIEITNHSNNFTLTNPRIYTYSGYCSHPPQPTIGKMMKEACSFSKTPRTACGCVGVLTYQVLSNEEKHVGDLAIMFSVPFDYNLYENMFALGIYEPNKACDNSLYTEMYNGNAPVAVEQIPHVQRSSTAEIHSDSTNRQGPTAPASGSIMAVALAIIDGVSLLGRTIDQISQSINTGRNVTIEITNHSNNFTLTNPRIYTYSGYCSHPPQPTIGKMMKEACSFSKTPRTACGSVGVLTYQVLSNEEKHVSELAIMFSVPFDYNLYENMFALGIYEPNKACDKNLYTEMYNGNGSIMAVALAIVDGVSLSGTSVEQISQSINTGRNATIEITNYSNKFTLTNPRIYTYSGYCYHPPQPTIGKMTKEACSFSKTAHTACGSVGVLTYQICSNEEKHVGDLAIMFSVPFDYNHYENMFALGIYEPHKACSIMAVALAIIDGVSLSGTSVEQISQSINTGRNVTIEITNYSNKFTLTNPRTYTYSGYCYHPPQPTIGKMMREACSFSKTSHTACGSVGVLTYQIRSNEEKHVGDLAIMFSVPFDYNHYENMFALGIYEPNKACDDSLYNEMYYGEGSIMAVALAIIDGVSLLGRTIDQISQSINTGRNVTIEITNHSNNFTLTNPRIYTYSGYCSHPPQPTIGKMMKEACSFSKTPRTACGSVGVLTYQVLSNEEKHVSELAIMFSVPFDYNLYENMFALGIYEPNKACDKNLYTEMYNGNGSIMAVALAIIDGVSLSGTSVEQISQSINTGRNVTIEITNYSNKFTLTNPRTYTYSGYCYHPPQPTIGKMMREACSFSKTSHTACGSVGVLTYQIICNEEKHVGDLAIMFSVPFDYNHYENMFALGIYEPNKACDDSLYNEMYYGEGSIMAVALAIIDGVSLLGRTIDQISQSINTGRNVTIEITNHSNNFTLTNPRIYTYSGYCSHPPQPTIGKMMKEACSFSKTPRTACGCVGVLTYQVLSNEEKHVSELAIMFSVPFDYNLYENMFALGIYEPNKACDKNLYTEMYNGNGSIMAVALAIVDGVSLSGTSVEQISQSINTGRNATIEITNYSNKFTLTNPRTYTYSGYCYHPPQPTIGKMMREACSFSKTAHTACGSVGVLTYQICSNEEKHVGDLAIMFSVPFDYNHYENMFALGIYEPHKACSIMAVALAIIDGVSLSGTSVEQISQSINTGRNVTIEITNYSNKFTLTNPRTYTYSGYCYHPPQPTIGKMMREACSFSKTSHTACGSVGVLTYQIICNEEKHVGDLAIMFSVPFDYNHYENMFALGIYEPHKACDKNLYTEMYYGEGSIMAVALAIIDGVSLSGTSVEQISQSINTGRNVTIEITNYSNKFTLTNPRTYTYSGYCYHPPQPTIGKMMKEACSFSKTPRTACGSVGVLTYQIICNEEKHVGDLAIMFSVPFDYNHYENMFALGIYEPNKACDDSLYNEMYYGEGSIMAVALAIIDGVSLLGRTIDQISQSINTGRNVTIEITNHSNNFTLTNPRIYTYSGYCSHPPQPTIGKMMKEACSFSKTPRTACGSVGVLTYQILSNEEKHVSELAIMFSVPFDYNLYENMFALGIYEPNKACDKNLYTEMYNGNGSIMAVALAIVDGVSLSGTSVEQISQSINTGRNATIEITNYSNKFTLTNPRTYTYSGYCYHPPQPTIGKMMREACSFSKTSHTACGSVGVLTYQICSNEEKHVGDLAIMFSVPYDYNQYENMFALGIYEPHKACSIMAVALAIIDGVSLSGTSVEQISQSINTGRNVTIEITNHSNNFTLTNPRTYTYSGYCYHPPQPTIGKMMREACSFSKTSHTACGSVGVLTYQILSNEGKHVGDLAIMFSVPYDYNQYENMFALGIYEPNKACDKNLYTEMYYCEGPFKRENGTGNCIIYSGKGVELKGTMSDFGQSIIRVEFWG
ncbi:hypothetical protein MHYP_G00142890 [Metynnis hypsauchen]